MNTSTPHRRAGHSRAFRSALSLGLATVLTAASAVAATSPWAEIVNGKLQYQTTSRGDRIMDFSHAGYKGGGVALPTSSQVPARRTLSPSGGDDTDEIQAAINYVAGLTPDSNGLRGAVQLNAGLFRIDGVINLNVSGVVLRGSGSSSSGTRLLNTNRRDHIIYLGGSGGYSQGTQINITNSYVPSGRNWVDVADGSQFRAGDTILITRTATAAWIAYVEMDNLIDNGVKETWMSPGNKMLTDRIVTSVSGNRVTFDAPLTDSFDSQYLGNPVGTVCKYTFSGRISQSGVERLRIECNNDGVGVQAGGIMVDKAIDCWLSDVYLKNGYGSLNFEKATKRCTIDRVTCENDIGYDRDQNAPPSLFSATGTQLFFNRCQALRTNTDFLPTIWSFSSGSTGTGPIAILNFYSTHRSGVAPHMRWTTGFLVDSSRLPDAPSQTEGIAYSNRGTAGSGHGWVTAWSVAWNVDTPYLRVQQAPGTLNWSIGSGGTPTQVADMGTFDSTGVRVTPSSLYLQQLKERLGSQALANIGYPEAPAGDTVAAADGFVNFPLGSTETGTFTIAFDATPSTTDATIALCDGAQTAYTGLAAIVRFNTSGNIDARNGGAYAAASTIPYSTGTTYRFRLVVNTAAHTYSAYVTPAGGSEVTIGTNYAFRTEQASVTQLDTLNVDANTGSITVGPRTITHSPVKQTVPAGSVTASAYSGSYVPANTVDGSLSTRWTSSGDGQWIRYDLGSSKTVSYVKVAFYAGDTRTYYFDVQTSTDGSTWTTVVSNRTSSATTALQTVDFTDRTARYVRIVGHVGTYDNYNNITETEIWGY